ncbi:MAG: ribosomal protein [Gammaproteobacteria bacterium]|nr:ribosomal protein [Gammaproteobacteria bacterium]
MANTPQARKRAKQAEQHRQHNMAQRSNFRTHIKQVVNRIEAGDKKAANESLIAAIPVIDSAVNKGLIHRNKAARHKSRLHKRVQALA